MHPQLEHPAPTNGELWKTVRMLADGKKISPALRDRLMFAAMDDFRNKLINVERRLNKIWPIYQVLAILGGLAMVIFSTLITLFLTGKLIIERMP